MIGAEVRSTVAQRFPASRVSSMRPPHGAGGTGSLLDSLHVSTATTPTYGETKAIDQIGAKPPRTDDQCLPESTVDKSTSHGDKPDPHGGLDEV
jgi:hypothetical protein